MTRSHWATKAAPGVIIAATAGAEPLASTGARLLISGGDLPAAERMLGRTRDAGLPWTGIAAYWDQFGPPEHCRKLINGDYRCQ